MLFERNISKESGLLVLDFLSSGTCHAHSKRRSIMKVLFDDLISVMVANDGRGWHTVELMTAPEVVQKIKDVVTLLREKLLSKRISHKICIGVQFELTCTDLHENEIASFSEKTRDLSLNPNVKFSFALNLGEKEKKFYVIWPRAKIGYELSLKVFGLGDKPDIKFKSASNLYLAAVLASLIKRALTDEADELAEQSKQIRGLASEF
ncbi:MAG: hypothetical protein V1804_01595 [Patescibacteria group bacterium]